ncbi:M4 family metallopeptidase [Streptomyces sp. BE303]|uniref:M4 family metallopeptidase n=1 Tax=Streptomyces sp. BE303 TaxID=3002528 RepID=UPI002E76A43B|nr:M4 family metallopeptidase [Streptomyces sp. BE303]MED7947383.1 M4 family metallopeptidase [Streptomyces sp. BE303]
MSSLASLAVITALLVTGAPLSGAQALPAVPTAPASRAAALAAADRQSTDLARSLGLSGQEKLVAKDAVRDADGTRHLRYERTYAGLPVLGGDLVVHQGADGAVRGVDRASAAALTGLATAPAVDAPTAQAAALGTEAGASVGRAPRLVVWAVDDSPRLAWETVIASVDPEGTPSKLRVVTDAATGAVIQTYEGVQTGSGHGVHVGEVPIGTTPTDSGYELRDGTRGGAYTTDMGNGRSGNGTVFQRSTDSWGDGLPANRESAAVDAHFGVGATWDYLKENFGREGIRGDGVGAFSRVHYGSGYVNAFWDDDCFCMTFGDGDADTHPLTSVDVAGHEMVHGVTSATAGLVYSGESGGLNEATSDIFGSMVEFHAALPADTPDYLIGEKADLFGDGTPLRYMDKPSKDAKSADYWYRGIRGLDVHYSSGVANHFFYLLSEGSGAKVVNGVEYDSPTRGGSTVTGIGRDRAAAVWYRALTVYMTSTTDYAGARTATLRAAEDLYGAGSDEHRGVADAWAAVNVGVAFPSAPAVTHPGDQVTGLGATVDLLIPTVGGAGAPTYTAVGLPEGLSIDTATGRVTGTPTAVGSGPVTVTATFASGPAGTTEFTWAVTDGTGPCPSAQLLANAGFESGEAAPWSAGNGLVDGSPEQAAHGGAWKAWLNGYGSSRRDTLSQTVTIPAGCRATLGYWLHIDSAETTGSVPYDRLTVTVDGTELVMYSNLDRAAGYTRRTLDLSSYAGQSVTVRFNGSEDGIYQTSFVLDDLSVEIGG